MKARGHGPDFVLMKHGSAWVFGETFARHLHGSLELTFLPFDPSKKLSPKTLGVMQLGVLGGRDVLFMLSNVKFEMFEQLYHHLDLTHTKHV